MDKKKIILLAFCFSGMAALMYEVVWTRFLILVFGSTTYAVSTMLAGFMAGLALGSFLVAKYFYKIRDLYQTYAYLELGIGIYGLLFIAFVGALQGPFIALYQALHGSFFAFSLAQFLLLFLVMLVPTALMGATFPIVTKIFADDLNNLGHDVGFVYSANTVGAVVGPFLAGFILIPMVGITATNMFAAVINISIAIVILNLGRIKIKSALLILPLFLIPVISPQPLYTNLYTIAAAEALQANPDAPSLQKLAEQYKASNEVLFYKEGAYGTVMVGQSGGVRSLKVDGRTDAGNDPADLPHQYMAAYLPSMFHSDPKTALVIGAGAGFTLGEFERFDYGAIDAIEIDPLIVEAALGYFSEYNNDAFSDPRVALYVTDARNFLLTTDKKYDVISFAPSHPHVSSISPLFTKEFFELSKKHLTEHGLYVQLVHLYYFNYDDFLMMLNTFAEVYPHVEVWMPDLSNAFLIGGVDPEPPSAGAMEARFGQAREGMAAIGIASLEQFAAKSVLDEDAVRRAIENVTAVNTDDRPILEFVAPQRMLDIPTDTPFLILNASGKEIRSV